MAIALANLKKNRLKDNATILCARKFSLRENFVFYTINYYSNFPWRRIPLDKIQMRDGHRCPNAEASQNRKATMNRDVQVSAKAWRSRVDEKRMRYRHRCPNAEASQNRKATMNRDVQVSAKTWRSRADEKRMRDGHGCPNAEASHGWR